MQKFNIMRPLLILAVAYFAKSLTKVICLGFGAAEETADNISFMVMIIAAILTYMRISKSRHKR